MPPFGTVSALISDTSMAYSPAPGKTVVSPGDVIEAGPFRYWVAASSATDSHVVTSGGVKLYVMANQDGRHSVLAFGAVGDAVTDDYASCQKAANTGLNVVFPKGFTFRVNTPLSHTSDYQVFYIEGVVNCGAEMDAAIHTVDRNYCGVSGFGAINANTIGVNGVHFQSDQINAKGCFVENIFILQTKEDVTLQRGAVLFDTTGGKSGVLRNKKVRVENVRIWNCQTHGILIAYSDGVRVLGNEIDTVRNHGHESVNCTDVIVAHNDVKNCLISGLGVGDNCQNWTISDNVIRNCAGDGAITCEHNSVHGSVTNNQLYDCYGSSCINVSFGTPVAGAFSTIHNISVTGNHCHAKNGNPTIRGILCYADVSAPGYAIDISGNTADNVFLGMDVNYLTDSTFSKNKVNSFQGPSGFTAAVLTYCVGCELDGLLVRAGTDDHAVIVRNMGANVSDRCTVKGVKTFTVPNSKSVVYIQAGIIHTVFDIETNSAKWAVEVGSASTMYHAAGITGNYVSGVTSGGTKLVWQA